MTGTQPESSRTPPSMVEEPSVTVLLNDLRQRDDTIQQLLNGIHQIRAERDAMKQHLDSFSDTMRTVLTHHGNRKTRGETFQKLLGSRSCFSSNFLFTRVYKYSCHLDYSSVNSNF